MHSTLLILAAIFAAAVIVIHLLFKAVKLTFIVFLAGAAILALAHYGRQYLGIDLLGFLGIHV